MARILVPLPDHDFDVTEVSVPWRLLSRGGHSFTFCTERGGNVPQGDPKLLTGVIFGQLGASPEACAAYRELEQDAAFRAPRAWGETDFTAYDGLLLPGGHAPGMRQYLGSAALQSRVASFFATRKPVAAICHGVLLAARSVDPATGKSVLYERTTTSLTKYQERLAYYLTAWKLGTYYRTYPAYVEDEVKSFLRDPQTQYQRGPVTLTARDREDDATAAFVVVDGTYVSARWPGDAHTFAARFGALLARGAEAS